MSSHACHAINCTTRIPETFFMCIKHWYMLLPEMRQEIWRTYVPGQEARKDPSVAYITAAKRARDYIAIRERDTGIALRVAPSYGQDAPTFQWKE